MKRIIFFYCLLSISFINAQKRAITDTGDEVVLNDDGTWEYTDQNVSEENLILLNPNEFEKDKNSSFLLKSSKLNLGVWLNPKKWTFTKSTDNPDAEYEFQLKGEDLYGMFISEKFEIPLETLRNIAIDNVKSVAQKFKIVKEEYRMVNGLKVLFIEMNGTIQGVKFSYYGYYYSNSSGTVQFITYTSQKLLETYRPDCDDLLNGLVKTKD